MMGITTSTTVTAFWLHVTGPPSLLVVPAVVLEIESVGFEDC